MALGPDLGLLHFPEGSGEGALVVGALLGAFSALYFLCSVLLAFIFVGDQLWHKHWSWLAFFLMGTLSATVIHSQVFELFWGLWEILYYILVLRGQLQNNAPPRAHQKWHWCFSLIAVLLWFYQANILRQNSSGNTVGYQKIEGHKA